MIRLTATALVALILLAGCDSNEGQNFFFEQSLSVPSGYTATSDDGTVDDSQIDPDDWRVAPFFQGAVNVDPVYPNPVSRLETVTIVVRDLFGDELVGGIRVRGYDDQGRSIPLGEDPGTGLVYVVSFTPAQLRVTGGDDARLYRLQIFDSNRRIISYGDLLVR